MKRKRSCWVRLWPSQSPADLQDRIGWNKLEFILDNNQQLSPQSWPTTCHNKANVSTKARYFVHVFSMSFSCILHTDSTIHPVSKSQSHTQIFRHEILLRPVYQRNSPRSIPAESITATISIHLNSNPHNTRTCRNSIHKIPHTRSNSKELPNCHCQRRLSLDLKPTKLPNILDLSSALQWLAEVVGIAFRLEVVHILVDSLEEGHSSVVVRN